MVRATVALALLFLSCAYTAPAPGVVEVKLLRESVVGYDIGAGDKQTKGVLEGTRHLHMTDKAPETTLLEKVNSGTSDALGVNIDVDKILPGATSLSDKILPVATSLTDKILPVATSLTDKILPVATSLTDKILPVATSLTDQILPVATSLTDQILPVATSLTDQILPVATSLTDQILPVTTTSKDQILPGRKK